MNSKRVISLLVALFALFATKGAAQYLLLDSTLIINSPTTYDSVRIVQGGILIAGDSIKVLGNMTIELNGVVTHSVRLLSGLRLNVSDTLEIKAGGMINVSGKGLLGGGAGGSIYGRSGETYNANDSIVAGSGAGDDGAGGSYGGQGSNSGDAAAGVPYGLMEEVRHLGSSGGSNYMNSAGGNGGGLVTITAGVCIVDGAVRANGINGIAGGPRYTGGGSGGGIQMNVGNLSGVGVIQSTGGNSGSTSGYGGSGGGGRIAIYYGALTLPVVNISAYGGSAGGRASAGTIYLKDNAQANGNVIIDNHGIISNLNTPWKSMLPSVRDIKIINRGALEISSEIRIEGDFIVATGGKFSRP